MGFNKRYIDKTSLLSQYESGGIKEVMRYLSNPDALISQDEFSSDITDIFFDEPIEEKCWSEIENKLQIALGSEDFLLDQTQE